MDVGSVWGLFTRRCLIIRTRACTLRRDGGGSPFIMSLSGVIFFAEGAFSEALDDDDRSPFPSTTSTGSAC